MRVAREILSVFLLLIALYLVLVHATGFAKDVGSLASGGSNLAKTFQGRQMPPPWPMIHAPARPPQSGQVVRYRPHEKPRHWPLPPGAAYGLRRQHRPVDPGVSVQMAVGDMRILGAPPVNVHRGASRAQLFSLLRGVDTYSGAAGFWPGHGGAVPAFPPLQRLNSGAAQPAGTNRPSNLRLVELYQMNPGLFKARLQAMFGPRVGGRPGGR